MADANQVTQAIAAVRGGTASSGQLSIVTKAASQAGSVGNSAREALRSAGE